MSNRFNKILVSVKAFLKNKIFLVPPICLLYTFFSSLYVLTNKEAVYLGNSFGYSIIVSLVMIYHYWFSGKYCWFTRISVLGMPIMNLIRLFKPILGCESYVFVFQTTIFTIVIGLSVYLKIKDS